MTTETQSLIRNPLTLISVFAGVAETSGAACLPFLNQDIQETYVWFLILFPPFLVALFFITLNWNHRVLYAPSDYRDERHFMGFEPARADQVREKIQDQQVDAESSQQAEPSEGELDGGYPSDVRPDGTVSKPLQHETMTLKGLTTVAVEDFALTKVAREFKLPLLRQLSPLGLKGVLFDAVAVEKGSTTVVEVISFSTARVPSSLRRVFDSVQLFWNTLSVLERERFSFICIAAGIEEITPGQKQLIYERMMFIAQKYDFNNRLIVYDRNDLDMGEIAKSIEN